MKIGKIFLLWAFLFLLTRGFVTSVLGISQMDMSSATQYFLSVIPLFMSILIVNWRKLKRMFWRRGSNDDFDFQIASSKNMHSMSKTDIAYELNLIDNMEGHEFEHWCANLLRKLGFINVEVTKGSGDQGVDVVAEKDGVRYAIQCKCYGSNLGNTPIQEVFSGKEFYGCQVGVVMTNRRFTTGAIELSKKTKVLLWGRDKLVEMMESVATE